MNNYIKIKNLTKKYEKNKSIRVLNDVSFNFEPGKTYSIMGPSGSGKSTLLNLLSLIDSPTAGSIEINISSIIIISLCSIIATILVSIYPASKASSLDTVKTLKYE